MTATRRPTDNRLVLVMLVAGAAVALLPRLVLTYFAYPSADDFCIVVETRDDGFWYMQVHSYLTWTGRYSAVFLESIVSQFDLAGVYPWFALATLVSTLVGIWMLVAALCGRTVSNLHVVAIAIVVAAIFVGGLPSTVEAFYWMPGEASYQWGIITYLVWLSLLIRIARREETSGSGAWRRTCLVVLTVCLPGFNEVMAPIAFATIIAFVLANRWKKFDSDRFMLMLLGVVIVLTAFCFVAPGNALRSSVYPALDSRHNLGFALAETARQTAQFLGRYGSYPALWLGAIAAWWWGSGVLPGELALLRRPMYAAGALLGLVTVIYLTLFPLYWEYGEVNYTGEGRTYNVTYVALCAVVLVTALLLRGLAERLRMWPISGRAHRGVDIALAGALAVALIVSPSTRGVFGTLEAAPAYLKEEQTRAKVLRTSPSSGVVFVDKISVRPPGLFWGDVESDENHWINTCVAKYYRLAAVKSRL